MKSCKQVTDEAVEAFIIFCQKISILIFDGCPLITGNINCTNNVIYYNRYCNLL